MKLEWTKCYWCQAPMAKSHPSLRWIDDYESPDCEYHPHAWDIVENKTTNETAPHQSVTEVHAIIRKEYENRMLLRKKEPLRAVTDNVVMLSSKAQRTSTLAAEKVLSQTGSLRKQIHDLVLNSGQNGMIDEELEIRTGGKHQSISASRRSLVLDGYLFDSGKTRKNRVGNECIIWVHENSEFMETLFND